MKDIITVIVLIFATISGFSQENITSSKLDKFGVELIDYDKEITQLNVNQVESYIDLINSYRFYDAPSLVIFEGGPRANLVSAKQMEARGYVFEQETLARIKSRVPSNLEKQMMPELNIGFNKPKAVYPTEY